MPTQYNSEVFELIIRDERTGSDSLGDNGTQTVGADAENNTSKLNAKTLITFEQAKGIAQNLINGVGSRVGALTGRTVLQNQINFGMSAVAFGVGFAFNPVLATAGKMVELTLQAIDRSNQIRVANIEASEMQRRSGNYLTNRNR